MFSSGPELPSEYVIRRCESTDEDYLKLLMMPKSPSSMPSWVSVNFLITLFEIRSGIVIFLFLQVLVLCMAVFFYGLHIGLLGATIYVDNVSIIIYLISFFLIAFMGTAIVMAQGGRGWIKDYPWRYWVIEQEDRFLGSAYFQNYETFSVIRSLRICSKWRGKGLGTAIVKKLIQIGKKPIYLSPALGTSKFYRRIGFRRVRFQKVSPKAQRFLIPTYCMAHYGYLT
ncbi:GNAT family N-acetyltransferase [Acaryochloris sp. IP29b_bin.137]|uniref:GNAT family N-acetyltransferase n=1 Tax=Acaryochloris sp. IP29b_bin.137 TaxID=2969217 RepID=UPI002604DCEB|nr:GNAT family N-acetyltransferase [Acaryochloris sp. IP29b_bin.137]